MIENEKDKPSLDELMHYGVKGMRWGHRKSGISSADIKDARARTAVRVREVNKAHTAIYKTKNDKDEKKAVQTYDKKRMEYLKNPDRATAQRLTTGEKFAIGLLGISGVGTPAAAGVLAGQQAAKKIQERSVAKYNK